MRTLDAGLEAALNAGAEPILNLQYCMDGGFDWLDAPQPLIFFRLGNLEFTCITAADESSFPWYAVRLQRGCKATGVPSLVTSSTYYVNEMHLTWGMQVEVRASLLPRGNWKKYCADGHQSYRTIITDACSQFGYTAAFEDADAAFWDNIFYPTGRTLVLQSPHFLFTLLHQKLFIYALDNNDNQILFSQWLDDQLVGTVGHPALETLTTFDWKKQHCLRQRMLMWRDEAASLHYHPNPVYFPNLPVHNLGYIESDAEAPTQWQAWHQNEDKRTFHLKYQDGDILHCSSGTYQVQVFEVLNPEHNPHLYLQFFALPKFANTEGGPLPSTLEAAAPYTPLNVSNFDSILGAQDNNLQAAMETLDDHDHPLPSHTHAAEEVSSGTLDGDRLPAISQSKPGGVPATGSPSGKFLKDDGTWAAAAGGGDVTGPACAVSARIAFFDGTSGKKIDDLGWSAASFAVASKGVTHGDTHAHNGGDGAQIDHGSLAGLMDHDHTQYILHTEGREKLTANRTYHVNATDGDDGNDGLAAGAGHAFETIQHAIDVAAGLDTNIYDVTIQLADGTYWDASADPIVCKNAVGRGMIVVQGNAGTPASVKIDGGFYKDTPGTEYRLKDLEIYVNHSANWAALAVFSGALICGDHLVFGAGWNTHLYSAQGTIYIYGNYEITGGATNHILVNTAGSVVFENSTITLTDTPSFNTFASVSMNGCVYFLNTTFSGSATGRRYLVSTSGVIDTGGCGASYLPGDASGDGSTAGCYDSTIYGAGASPLDIYPVGAVYISVDNTDPGTLFGGTWASFGAGRVLVGLDSGDADFDTAEETGGAKTHTLSTAELPAHTHGLKTRSSTAGSAATYVTDSADTSSTDAVRESGSAGSGNAHNNMQPYIVVYMWKRTA